MTIPFEFPYGPSIISSPEESRLRYRAIVDAFVEVAAIVEELRDLDTLLTLVARHVCELTGIRRCALYLLGDDGLLHGRVGHGPDPAFNEEVRQMVTVLNSDGLAQELIEGGSPILVDDAGGDPRTAHEMMRHWAIRSLLAVPLTFGGEVIGTIHLDNLDEAHAFSELDVDVAQTFASLAASAIAQAAMAARIREREMVKERQRDHLEQLGRIHANLTEAVLQGDDIPTVLDRLVAMMERTVVLRDRDFGVLAWSAPESAGSNFGLNLAPAVLAMSYSSCQPSDIYDRRPSAVVETAGQETPSRHLLAPIQVEGELTGYLDLVEGDRLLDDLDARVMEHAATVVALVLLSERRSVALRDQEKERILTSLLQSTRPTPTLDRRAFLSGINLARRHLIMLFVREHGGRGLWLNRTNRESLCDAALAAAEVSLAVSVLMPEGLVVLLGPFGEDADGTDEAARSVAREVLEQFSGSLPVRRVAVAGVRGEVDSYRSGYRDLVETLALSADFGWSRGVVAASELGTLRLLATEQQRGQAVSYSTDLLRSLLANDEMKNGEMLATLRTFIECNGSNRVTAERLGVHENTVRYRLTRIRELSGKDPTRFDDLVDLRFALHVLDLAGDAESDDASPPAY